MVSNLAQQTEGGWSPLEEAYRHPAVAAQLPGADQVVLEAPPSPHPCPGSGWPSHPLYCVLPQGHTASVSTAPSRPWPVLLDEWAFPWLYHMSETQGPCGWTQGLLQGPLHLPKPWKAGVPLTSARGGARAQGPGASSTAQ